MILVIQDQRAKDNNNIRILKIYKPQLQTLKWYTEDTIRSLYYLLVPNGFRYSYIVPVPKLKEHYSKTLTCDDLRAIAISPILCKVFEHCSIERYRSFLVSSDDQFGFKNVLAAVLLSEQIAA